MGKNNQTKGLKKPSETKSKSGKSIGFLVFVIILLASVVAVQISSLYVRNQELEQQELQLQEEFERALELEQELESYKEFMFSDDYIEQLARERLNLIRPDEIKIIPIDE